MLYRSRARVWFLLHRGQFHLSRTTQASAPLSTGVLTVRGTPGQLLEILRCIQIAVHDLPACRVLTAKGAVFQRQLLVHPATPTACLGGCEPAVSHDHLAAMPHGFVLQLSTERTP